MRDDPKLRTGKNRIVRNTLYTTMIILAIIGVVMVIRRVMLLTNVTAETNLTERSAFDSSFSQHKLATLIHILPGLLFMVLGPLQFYPWMRRKSIRLHRWSGRVFFVAAFIVGISGISLPFMFSPIGGVVEGSATILFGLYFLVALAKGWQHIRRSDVTLHRQWMIRAFAVGLAVAGIRPIIALFFALSAMEPQEFFGIAFWIGFTVHVAVAEVWIYYTRTGAV